MACNENVIKNMANEITRNCQAHNVVVDPEYVIYIIELILLNPKYGKLFATSINRDKLAYFVNIVVEWLKDSTTQLDTLKLQFIVKTNYNKLSHLIDDHLDSIDKCLKPLVDEILEVDPMDEAEFKKLFRKISIYIILASGLGNPGHIVTLKEGMAALESIYDMDSLHTFVALSKPEKMSQLKELLGIVSGVRLFNKDCKKGGDGIQELPFNLVDAAKACLSTLMNSLITIMHRVNKLTTAIEDSITIEEETGNVVIEVGNPELRVENYYEIFDLLSFNRQHEIFIRKLLSNMDNISQKSSLYVERYKHVLDDIHKAVKYKSAVPIVAVFPLFTKLWQVWRDMQNMMYLVSTVNRLITILDGIQEQIKPPTVLKTMLEGKEIVVDQDRMRSLIPIQDQKSLKDRLPSTTGIFSRSTMLASSLMGVQSSTDGLGCVEFLGFCALCLNVGAMIPSNVQAGIIKYKGRSYSFCSVKMAARFCKEPERYINETIQFARANPHLINLLNIIDNVTEVKHVENLVTVRVPKKKVKDQDMQTETHPHEEYIEKDFNSDLWEWKRRACQWANIVNCRTHSTQTYYSHLRSEIHCQTVEPRDKCLQTKKDCGINTINNTYFLYGLRGKIGYGQHRVVLQEPQASQKMKVAPMEVCQESCLIPEAVVIAPVEVKDFYVPEDTPAEAELTHQTTPTHQCHQ